MGKLTFAALLFTLSQGLAAADLGPDLLAAARKGQTDRVRKLLDKGAPLEAKDKDGRTPLLLAAQHDHAETVRLLIAKGADPAMRDPQGWTARGVALVAGHEDVLKALPPSALPRFALDTAWIPTDLHSSCFLTLQQLAQQISAMRVEARVAAAFRQYAATSGKGAVELTDSSPDAVLHLRVRPAVSCVQQDSTDNVTLTIDARLVRTTDQETILEKTFGGGFKGLHARSVTSPAQYPPLFDDWAKSHAGQIYWSTLEAWLRTP